MLNCTTDRYERLYARWLKGVDRIIRDADVAWFDRVLDLCGGTGVVALAAVLKGCENVVMVDLNPRAKTALFKSVKGRAEDVAGLVDGPFDVVICRQALGYLDLAKVADQVGRLLPDGGRFVFNTFAEPRWHWQRYRYDGTLFFEASAVFGKTVFHVQASPTIGVDLTRFHWYGDAEIRETLAPLFDIEVKERDRSLTYVCTRRR